MGTEPESGDVVYIRYKDHIFFKDMNSSAYAKPFVRETLGWLDHENGDCIRIVWERFAQPTANEVRQRTTGLVILKSSILELRRVG